jgi:hypothetical protein
MCALKPPFDAKSLPALAIKISKGEYSPIPALYSKEMRKLVSDILVVDAPARPTVEDILRMPVVRARVCELLSKSDKAKPTKGDRLDRPLSALVASPYSQVSLALSPQSHTPTGSKNIEINVRKKIRDGPRKDKDKDKGERTERAKKMEKREVSEGQLSILGTKIEKSIHI